MRCRKFLRLTRARSMLGLRDAKEIGIGRIACGLVFPYNFYFWRIFNEKVHLPFLEPNPTGSVNNEKKTGERMRVNEHELWTRRVENKESSLFSREFFPEKKTRMKCNRRRPRSSPLYLTTSSTIFVFGACNSAFTRISANSSFKSLLVQQKEWWKFSSEIKKFLLISFSEIKCFKNVFSEIIFSWMLNFIILKNIRVM